MQIAQDARPQDWPALDMARGWGVDLPRAMLDGLLSPSDCAEALRRCRTCAAPRACRDWLGGAAEMPQACRNGPLFSELRML